MPVLEENPTNPRFLKLTPVSMSRRSAFVLVDNHPRGVILDKMTPCRLRIKCKQTLTVNKEKLILDRVSPQSSTDVTLREEPAWGLNILSLKQTLPSTMRDLVT